MKCLFCGNRIGFLRRTVDRQFCNDEHRRRHVKRSAMAAREVEWTGDVWEEGAAFAAGHRHVKGAENQHSQANAALIGFAALVGVVVLFIGLPSSAPVTRSSSSLPSLSFTDDLKSAIRSRAAVHFRDDFRAGIDGWLTSRDQTNGWSYSSGVVRPGSLRLWSKSMKLSDYNFDFSGQIERKGIGWVFRAKDDQNYYATKILITRPGPLPGADILRYAVLDGKESNRVRLPLPLQIRSDTVYNVRVAVKGDQFTTFLDGQTIDSWHDNRLSVGGVGFFADRGEVATVRSAAISDRNTFMGRLFSYLQAGFWMPSYLPEAAYTGLPAR